MAERSIYIFYVKYDFYPPYAWTVEIEKNVRGSINTQLSTFSLLIIVNIILLKSTPIYEQDEIINLLPGVDK